MRLLRSKLAIVLASAIVLYGLVGFLVAPGLVRDALLDSLGKTFKTKATIQKVRVNPFALSLTLEFLNVPDTQGATAVGFDKIYLRFNVFSPFFGAWTLDELRIVKPVVNVAILPDRTLNLFGILRHPPAPDQAPADTMAAPPSILIRRLRIENGIVGYQDLSRQPELRKALIPLRVELKDFTTRRDRKNAYSLDASTERGEALAWNGRFTLQPFRSDGRLQIRNVQASTVEDFMSPPPRFRFDRGLIDLEADYRVDAAATPAQVGLSNLHVSARGVSLADRASGEETIAAARIETQGGEIRTDRLLANLGTIRADSLRLVVWMDSTNTTNLQRWASSPAAGDTAAAWTTKFAAATLTRGEVEYQERRISPAAALRLHDLRAELKRFDLSRDSVASFSAACSTGTGGRLEATGTSVPSTGALDATIHVADFDLRQVQGFLSPFARLDIVRGVMATDGRLRMEPAAQRLRFEGNISSARLKTVDRSIGQDFLRWEQIAVRKLEVEQGAAGIRRMAIQEIVANGPYIRFVVSPTLRTSVQEIFVPPDSLPPAFRPKAGAPDTIPAAIGEIRVIDGSMYFADLSLKPNFATGIEKLNGSIREISSARAAHAIVDLKGQVDAYAPVTFEGTLNPLNSRGVTDVAAKFQNIELTTFTPYSGKFMGYEIARGKLDLDLKYYIEDRKLKAENKILMRQLTLGRKIDSPEATSLPVKFAIALLKDKDGDIHLDLPVHGDLDDPKFSVVPIVMKVLVNLVVKAVTSPFKLFGAIFGGDDEEVAPAIRFPYGTAALDTTEVRKLDAIRQGLVDRPGLRLEVEQAGDRQRDSLAIAEARYRRLLRDPEIAATRIPEPSASMIAAAALRETAGLDATAFAGALSRAFVARVGPIPPLEAPPGKKPKDPAADPAWISAENARLAAMETRVRAAAAPSPDEISGLAVDRARRVQGYVLRDSTVAAERVFIVADKAGYPPDSLGVQVGLTLTE